MGCSVFALITFCKQPTLSGITFGLNIISTAFLSPVLVAANSSASAENGNAVYWFYVGFHIVLMLIAFVLYIIFRKK